MNDCLTRFSANPASQHRSGQEARRVLEDARERIASALGIDISRVGPERDRLVFTSGGTEANNLAIRGLARNRSKRVIVSAIEHPSVLDVARDLANTGFNIQTLSAQASGIVAIDQLHDLVATGDVQLVSVMLANNETGAIQPVKEIVEICAEGQIPVHTDAVQAIGRLPVNFSSLGAATLSVSAHKFQGPVGIGALAIRSGVQVAPLMFGGHQQLGQRPGSEPVALAVGMAKALELCLSDGQERVARLRALRDRLEGILLSSPIHVRVNGREPRLCQTSNLSFPGIDRQALLMALDWAGIECSTGSACASGSSERSHVLVAMGLPEEAVSSALRFSLGPTTTADQIDDAAAKIIDSVQRLHRIGLAHV
jgi:cysteine desulfurase